MHQTVSDHLILSFEAFPNFASGTSINRAAVGSIRAMRIFMRAIVILSRTLSHDESKSVLLEKVLGLKRLGSASAITALETAVHNLRTREDGRSGR